MPRHSVCTWWLGYLLASPVRRLWQDPEQILRPHVRPGMTVLEPGPGMGFFTLELLRLNAPSGRVVAIEIQEKMLAELRRRAARAGVLDRLDARLAAPESMGIGDLDGTVDFTLAFAVVHEMPDSRRFFGEVSRAMKPGGRVLFAEPSGHVKAAEFEASIGFAAGAGLAVVERPGIRSSRAAVLEKS